MRNCCLSLIVVCFILLPLVCVAKELESTSSPSFNAYTQIPGITDEEIRAVEDLKKNHRTFSYGMIKTTETFLGEDGMVEGFTRLFSERLSELFGIKFVPVIYGWDELNTKLNDLTLDFTGELTTTPARERRYFMTEPIIYRSISVFTNKNNPPLEVTAKERPLRFGFLKTRMVYGLVRSSLPRSAEMYFLKNEAQSLLSLESGEIDAFISITPARGVFEDSGFVKETTYYPLRYSSSSLTTANPELRPIINVVRKYLRNGGVDEVADMYTAGLDKYSAYKVSKLLTDEEKAYIADHLTPETAVPLGCEGANYPVVFYNRKEKAFQGIALDVLEEVSNLTGLKFKAANTPQATWPGLLTGLETGEIPLLAELITAKNKYDNFIRTSEHYNSSYYVLLSRADYRDVSINHALNAKVGLITRTSAEEIFHELFPSSMNYIVYEDYQSAFSALENNEIDLLMTTTNILLSLTNHLEKLDFKANITFEHPTRSLFGLNKNETVLRSILDKTLPFIDSAAIGERWRNKAFDYNSKMRRDMMPYVLAAFALLAAGLVTVCVLLIKNRKMSKNLEATVENRTRQLEHASRAKSDFLSRMSHEIRTPLNAVIGMAKVAETTNDISRLHYCLSVIGTSSAHLLNLINDILDMAKIEAGKLELNEAPLNIEKMLIQICNMIVAKTEEKKQILSVSIEKSLHSEYIGDGLRLSQVVTNLLSNAVKFTPEGGTIVVSVREKMRRNELSVLCFSVSDSGIGMTREQADRLFQAFSQADAGITKRFGGTGLGLAISKSIVEKMNGRIWVESELGKGATFVFEVELARCVYEQAPDFPDTRPPEEIRALVVDDDGLLRESLCGIVGQFNMQCRAAAGCGEAVAEIQSAVAVKMPYDVVFVGSASSGDECFETIRRISAVTSPDTVIVTASLSEWSQMESAVGEMGVYRVLFKPVFPSTVLQVIYDAIGTAAAPAVVASSGSGGMPDFSGITLLLVEDVEINREIFITLLEDTGIRIDIAENGLEAVRKFGSNPGKYDIIVMDVQMPVMDGYEAAKTIRSLTQPNAGTIPILAMTANALSEDVAECLRSGMNDHTVKPIDLNDLIEKIWVLTKKYPLPD